MTNFSNNDSPQTLVLDPAVQINESTISEQYCKFNKRIFDFSVLYHVSKTRYKYLASFGSLFETNKYNSENNNPDLSNYFKHQKNSFYVYYNINFKLNSLVINPSLNVLVLNQSLSSKNMKKNNFIIEPTLNVRYRLSDRSIISGNLGYFQKPFTEERLFENPVLINHRTIVQNLISLELQRTFDSKLTYAFNDDFRQTKFRINFGYSDQTGSFFSDISINPNISKTIFYYLPNKRITRFADFYFDKYVTFLDSVIKLNANYSSINSQNIVNNSEVRDILNHSIVNEFVYRTVFNSPINFENKITHHLSVISVDRVRNNSLNSINNSFKVFSKFAKKISLNVSLDYFRPNLREKTAFKFVDITLTYKYSKTSEVALISRNVFNQSSLTVNNVTDYSASSIQTNILPRQLMLFLSYSF